MPTNKHSSTAQGPGALEQRTGTASGALDKRTAETSQYTFQQQLDQLDERRKMIEAKAQGKDSFGHQLLQPKNILGMALAAAGMASGNNDLIAGGAGLGMGGIQGMIGAVDQNNMDRQKQIDSLTKMVDTQQQRLVTLLQTQPGLFVDEEGGAISSQEDWMDILPIGMPIDVESLVRRKAAGGKDPAADIASKIISTGVTLKNPVMIADGLRRYYAAAGIDMSEEQIKMMSLSTPENFVDQLLKNHTGTSVTKLILEANRRGLPVMAPELNNILQALPEGLQPSTTTEQGVYDAQESLRKWLLNDDHLALWEKNRYDALEQAFESDPVGLAALQDSSQFFNRGPRTDEMRLEAEIKMWADAHEMMMLRGGALSGDSDKMKALRSRMSKELDSTFRRGRDVVTIGKNIRSARAIGAQFNAVYPSVPADLAGSQIVVRSNSLMRQAGLEPVDQPNSVVDKFLRASSKYQELLVGAATEEEYRALLDAARASVK